MYKFIKKKLYFFSLILKFFFFIKNKPYFCINFLSLFKDNSEIKILLNSGETFLIRDLYDLIVLQEVFQEESYQVLFKNILPNSAFIDIGGYIGDTAIYAANQASFAQIVVFEPVQANFKVLEKNIKINTKSKRIKLINKALIAKKAESKHFFVGKNKSNAGFDQKEQAKNSTKVTTMQVSAMSKLLKAKNYYFKIDTEGSESEIIKGISKKSLKKTQAIMFEYHLDLGRISPVIEYLKSNGFKIKIYFHPLLKTIGTALAYR